MNGRLHQPCGRCLTCGVEEPTRTANFLCGACAHPEKIIEFCERCRRRTELVPAALVDLQRLAPDLHIPDQLGLSIVVEYCAHCALPEERSGRMTITVHCIAPSVVKGPIS